MAAFYFTKRASMLHLLLEDAEGAINVVVANKNLH